MSPVAAATGAPSPLASKEASPAALELQPTGTVAPGVQHDASSLAAEAGHGADKANTAVDVAAHSMTAASATSSRTTPAASSLRAYSELWSRYCSMEGFDDDSVRQIFLSVGSLPSG